MTNRQHEVLSYLAAVDHAPYVTLCLRFGRSTVLTLDALFRRGWVELEPCDRKEGLYRYAITDKGRRRLDPERGPGLTLQAH